MLKPQNSQLWYKTVNDWVDEWTKKQADSGRHRDCDETTGGQRDQKLPFHRKPGKPRAFLNEAGLYDYAIKALGRAMRTEAELRRLMRTRVEPGERGEAVIAAVVARLKEYGYLDDAAFAETYARLRQENEKLGQRSVRQKLRRRAWRPRSSNEASKPATAEPTKKPWRASTWSEADPQAGESEGDCPGDAAAGGGGIFNWRDLQDSAPVGCAGRSPERARQSGRRPPRRLGFRQICRTEEVEARAIPPLAQKQIRAENGAPGVLARTGYRNAVSGRSGFRGCGTGSQLPRASLLGAHKRQTRLGRSQSNGFPDRSTACPGRPARDCLSIPRTSGEHVGAGGAIANGKRLTQRPIMINGAAIGDDGAKSVLETLVILGLAADLDVGDETEHCSAPVGATPGMRLVQSLNRPLPARPYACRTPCRRHTCRASSSPVSTRAMGSM